MGISGGGGFMGSQIQMFWETVNWNQIWYKSADSSGNGHVLNTIRPSIPQGVLWGHKFKCLGSCQTARPIDIRFGTYLRIRLGILDTANYNSPLITTGGHFVFFGFGTKFGTRLWIHLGMDIG